MNNFNKRIKHDAKQIKRAFITTLAIHIMTVLFLLGVAFYIGFATLKYFGIVG